MRMMIDDPYLGMMLGLASSKLCVLVHALLL